MQNLKQKAIKSLKKKGYFVFKSFFSEEYIDKLNNQLLKLKPFKQASFFKKGSSDAKIIFNLQSKHKIFVDLLNNEIINLINTELLNDKNYKGISQKLPNYILSQYVARSSGKNRCDVHIDDKSPNETNTANYLQWAIPMIDLNTKNGCTQLLEKSHLSLKKNKSSITNFKDLILKKGDLAVWDGSILHTARPNKTNSTRWVIILTYARWFFKPHYDIPRNFPKKFYKYLDNKKKIILGFASIPKSSENIGTYQRGNLKTANDFIKKRIF